MSVRDLTDKNDDGTRFGQATTEKLGFYGLTTPIVQPVLSGAVTKAASTGCTVAEWDDLYASFNLMRTRLIALGLMA